VEIIKPEFQPETDVDMGLAELIWSPQGPMGQWFFTALYNQVEADRPILAGLRRILGTELVGDVPPVELSVRVDSYGQS